MEKEVRYPLAAAVVVLTASCTTRFEGSDAEEEGDAAEGEVLDAGGDAAADQDGRDREGEADDGRDQADGDVLDGNGDPGQDLDGQEQDGDVETEEEEREPVCGNGIREGTEACDDGGADPCGSCNADCTEDGTGSVCGDGLFCPDTEFCDDGGTDACFTCNPDCTGPGNGTTCGSQLWSKRFGGTSDDQGNTIAVDSSNNAIITGLITVQYFIDIYGFICHFMNDT